MGDGEGGWLNGAFGDGDSASDVNVTRNRLKWLLESETRAKYAVATSKTEVRLCPKILTDSPMIAN